MKSPPLSRFRSPAASAVLATGLVALSLASAGCSKPAAFGEANSLIVVSASDLWDQVEDSTYAALEPTVFTTRDEKQYVVTHVDPATSDFQRLKLWRQLFVFATPEDPLIVKVARAAHLDQPRPGTWFQATNVWARDQLVTAVVLEPGQERRSWLAQLPALAAQVDRQYRDWMKRRMFASGIDTATASILQRKYGVTLTIPHVYQFSERDGGIVVLRNDNPDPSDLIRSVLIQVLPRRDSLTEDALIEWRRSIGQAQYNVKQRIAPAHRVGRSFAVAGRPALEVTGIWEDENPYPAAGPFIAWAVQCPGRTAFLDAWLYAPRKDKYQYVLQLREILASFRCGPAPNP